jgi:hypothetical protein
MHVQNLDVALSAMADMLTDDGTLLLEVADMGSLAFSPADPASDLWRPWWYAPGPWTVRRSSCARFAEVPAQPSSRGFAGFSVIVLAAMRIGMGALAWARPDSAAKLLGLPRPWASLPICGGFSISVTSWSASARWLRRTVAEGRGRHSVRCR